MIYTIKGFTDMSGSNEKMEFLTLLVKQTKEFHNQADSVHFVTQ